MVGLGLLEVGDLLEERLLGLVEMAHEVLDAAAVLERDLLLVISALVDEADLETAVQERHHLQALEHRLRSEVGLFEDGGIGPERHRRASAAARCLAGDLELALRLATLRELEPVVLLRSTSSTRRLDNAFTTETPTPWRPPETL